MDAHGDLARESNRHIAYTSFFSTFLLLKKEDEESKKDLLKILKDGDCFYNLNYNPYFKEERSLKGPPEEMLEKLIEIRGNLESNQELLKVFLVSMKYTGPYFGKADDERLRLWKIVKSNVQSVH